MQMCAIQILGAEFTQRSQRNPRYSLRAFARSLGMSHTILSLVLSGKRPLSRKAALRLSERLSLSPEKSAALLQREKKSKNYAGNYVFIDPDTFQLISDWVHYAILSLLEISDTKFDSRKIAQRLGINVMQAKIAMERLQKLGLVKKIDGRWRQSGKPIKVENTISTPNTRQFHRQLIEKSLESLENDPIEIRDISSITLAMDPKLIPYAKERIRQFRRELTAELEAKGNPREVYNLTVQIYPVSRRENSNE